MQKKFKKRFRSLNALLIWANKNTCIRLINSCDVKYYLTKSGDGRKEYHHFEGTYTPKEEG